MSEPQRPRVLFVQSNTLENGGRSAVFAWMLEALRDDYELTIFTWRPFDVSALNERYGTTLRSSDVRFTTPSRAVRAAATIVEAVDSDPGSIQRTLLLARASRQWAPSFALTIACEMESDFGVPGLQYIHYPWLARFYPPNSLVEGDDGWRKLLAVLRGQARPWQWIGDFSFQRMRSNRTLTNSMWTADRVRRSYDIQATTLSPAAPGVFEAVPWVERANGFVAIGRIHPEKRWDWIIEALAPLRATMPNLHLHLIGTVCLQKKEQKYFTALQQLVMEHASWVTLHVDLSRPELAALVVQQRYGIHAMLDEHFGIAVAEMVRGGCIPFAHKSGGPAEILNSDARLLYNSAEELQSHIMAVACSAAMQESLREELAHAAARYSPQHFMHAFREIVAATLAERRMVG